MATGEERIDNDLSTSEADHNSSEPVTSSSEGQPVTPAEPSPEIPQPSQPTPVRPAITSVRGIVWNLLGALGFGALGFFALSLISHQMNVVKVVKSLNPGYILAAVVLIFFEIVFQALRLQAIVRAVGLRVAFRTAMRNILVGEFFARLTPFEAGGGEPAQIYMLYRDDSIKVADSTMVFAIKAILAGVSQMVVLVFVPVWLIFSGRSLDVGNRFRLILYLGIAGYIATFAFLILCLTRLPWISNYIDRLLEHPVDTLNRRGRFWQRLAHRIEKFIKDSLKARETAIKANRPMLAQALIWSFVCWGLVVLTPIILLYGLGVTSSVTQIIVATLIYYLAVSYFPTPGASVGAELGAAALFAAFVPNGILGAFILIWRFFDHYVKMGAGGITALGEFVLKPARRLRERRKSEKDAGEDGKGATKP
ncbi:MAG: lysylphosphatidylglycerol synthase transmembrane domain-containing protein [Candidatus Cryosericum sp.]